MNVTTLSLLALTKYASENTADVLGRKAEASVFLAEFVGIHMAVEMGRLQGGREVTIFSDSQTAIQAIDGPQATGQQAISMIAKEWDTLRTRGVHVVIRWISGRQGIEGNEIVDKAAKEATGWRLVRNTRTRRPYQHRLDDSKTGASQANPVSSQQKAESTSL
ncbi:hypothetical protein IFM58399_08529 [Aspergillus lentulus]|uniref:ribonuclease H family protein n=1 Tax=Aspergillus lentulus TaxID=293939 RepID=UPI001395076B|nr:uncharacterized protein IFM58399_08529 [Aspergillus lentulus]GFF49333.1 hypothetical protein IFM58399_08529 [Aspergillus lentulus]